MQTHYNVHAKILNKSKNNSYISGCLYEETQSGANRRMLKQYIITKMTINN